MEGSLQNLDRAKEKAGDRLSKRRGSSISCSNREASSEELQYLLPALGISGDVAGNQLPVQRCSGSSGSGGGSGGNDGGSGGGSGGCSSGGGGGSGGCSSKQQPFIGRT